MGAFDQDGFAARFDWGAPGVRTLEARVDVLVIVDVLSFSTAVEVATARGACVFPYRWRDASARAFAAQQQAVLAVSRDATSVEQPYSLSPVSLRSIPPGTRLVLPSPNGSTLTQLASGTATVLAGCLRNARAVSHASARRGTVGVIAAGEVRRDGSLRFAIEDLLGAGAILSHFAESSRSPEAEVAVAAYRRFEHDLPRHLAQCASGRELVEIGFAGDVELAAQLDVSESVPVLGPAGAYLAEPT